MKGICPVCFGLAALAAFFFIAGVIPCFATEYATSRVSKASAKKPEKSKTKVQKRTRSTQPAPRKTGGTSQSRISASPRSDVESPGDRLSVLVIGDSLAVGVGMTLDSAFQGRTHVSTKKMGKVSSGLDSVAFYDWRAVLTDVLDRERYDLIVVMLGANDAHNSPGTSAWGRLYESKFSELLTIPARRRIKTLVVGLPPMRKSDFSQRVQVTNEAIRNAVRLFPETCVYIDAFRLFSDEGGHFTDSINVRGELKKVRAGDGVHFTGTGYLELSKRVADEALAQ